jgi:hypothetical protein
MLIITKEALPNFILLSVWLLVVKSSSISGCLWIQGCYITLANIFDQRVMLETLMEILTMNSKSNDAPVIFLWEISHVI